MSLETITTTAKEGFQKKLASKSTSFSVAENKKMPVYKFPNK